MKIKLLFVLTSCKKCGPVQQTLNIIKNLDRNLFEPFLITLYQEEDRFSQLDSFLPYAKHVLVELKKTDIIFGKTEKLKKVIYTLQPDVIHTVGVFPDTAVSQYTLRNHVMTLRNYVWADYPKRFGWFRGSILALLQLRAAKKATKCVTCSKSLAEIYKKKQNLDFDYIRNGIDTNYYFPVCDDEKKRLRIKLGLSKQAFIAIYAAPINKRKNQRFLLQTIKENTIENLQIVLLGEGEEYTNLKKEFSDLSNVTFKGNVTNVREYLQASDFYISTSKAEGMPNAVLEAMAVGLPVVVSNISQHVEIFEVNDKVGLLYEQNNKVDFINQIMRTMSMITHKCFCDIREITVENFSAEENSLKYQEMYIELCRDLLAR